MHRVRREDLPFVGSSHQFVGADQGDVNVSVFLFHGLPGVHTLVHHWSECAANLSVIGALVAALLPLLSQVLVGVVAGSIVLAGVLLVKRLRGGAQATSH